MKNIKLFCLSFATCLLLACALAPPAFSQGKITIDKILIPNKCDSKEFKQTLELKRNIILASEREIKSGSYVYEDNKWTAERTFTFPDVVHSSIYDAPNLNICTQLLNHSLSPPRLGNQIKGIRCNYSPLRDFMNS